MACLLGACHPQTAAEAPPSTDESETPAIARPENSRVDQKEPGPAEIWREFTARWNAHDPESLASYEPEDGLLLLDNPGAFVRLRSIAGLKELAREASPHDGNRVFALDFSPQLEPGEAPLTTCESDEPLRGTFVTPSDRAKLTLRFQAAIEYELLKSGEAEALRPLVVNVEQKAIFAIYDLNQSVGFVFAKQGSQIKLLAIDAVIPCSA